MATPPAANTPISRSAFATLLLIALMMGANHVGARLAFNHGVDVVTAVFFRSAITAGVVGALLLLQRVPVLPRLGVVGNSAIMSIEPVFALVLAWLILGQAIAPVQVAGGLLVVATVIWLGWRRR